MLFTMFLRPSLFACAEVPRNLQTAGGGWRARGRCLLHQPSKGATHLLSSMLHAYFAQTEAWVKYGFPFPGSRRILCEAMVKENKKTLYIKMGHLEQARKSSLLPSNSMSSNWRSLLSGCNNQKTCVYRYIHIIHTLYIYIHIHVCRRRERERERQSECVLLTGRPRRGVL